MRIFSNYKEMIFGGLLSLVLVVFFKLFSSEKQLILWALTMTVILSMYVGFSLKEEHSKMLYLQIFGAALFLTLTLLGLWFNLWFLVAAYFLHGIWDIIHDRKFLKRIGLPWYADFCIVVDWLLGTWLIMEITVFGFGSIL